MQRFAIEAGLQGGANLLSQEILHRCLSILTRTRLSIQLPGFAQCDVLAIVRAMQGRITTHGKTFRTVDTPGTVHAKFASIFSHDYGSFRGLKAVYVSAAHKGCQALTGGKDP